MNGCTRSHVVVTGSSSGIGRASALRLAASGHHVYAGVRRTADAPPSPPGLSGEITPLLLDVTAADQVAAAAGDVEEHVGSAGLDGLVNNAGIGLFAPLEITPVDRFRDLLEVDVTGQLAVTQALLPLVRKARGRIVFIGSIGRRFTPPYSGAVAASKSAIAAMAEALRQELAPWDVGVVVIEPASINTEAVGKLDRDTERLMNETPAAARALYEGQFRRMMSIGAARERNGSLPETVAQAVARALTARRPRARYLVGKDSRRMALLAAVLPTPALDALRRRIGEQPARGSRI